MALSASSEVAYLTKQHPANANIWVSSQCNVYGIEKLVGDSKEGNREQVFKQVISSRTH
jgi:hypothetical protein